MKKLATSKTKEGMEKLINQYFYSNSYKVEEENGGFFITGKKGKLTSFSVVFSKDKFIFSEI